MPRHARILSAKAVESLSRKPGCHAVGGVPGLCLLVRTGGGGATSAIWVLRYVSPRTGRRRRISLGTYREVGLAEARERARALRQRLRDGEDPLDARQAARPEGPTFREVAERYLAQQAGRLSNPKYAAQVRRTMARYVYPRLGERPIATIAVPDVVAVLRPMWGRVTETASRLRQKLEKVFDYARVMGLYPHDNPARWRGVLEHLLPPPGKVRRVRHHRALHWQEVPAFMAELAGRPEVAARALGLVVLTACRSGEVRGMRWEEVDWARAVWTVPAERMKARRPHRVPLSEPALDLLRGLGPRDAGLVFPAPRTGAALSDMALLQVLRRMGWGERTTVHGFRSAFRTWVAEATQFAPLVAEAALAHRLGDKLEVAYQRSDLFDLRRRLMAVWGRFCLSRLATDSGAPDPLDSAAGIDQGSG